MSGERATRADDALSVDPYRTHLNHVSNDEAWNPAEDSLKDPSTERMSAIYSEPAASQCNRLFQANDGGEFSDGPAAEESRRPLRILMVGNDLSVRGGISSVIGQILRPDWSDAGIHIDFIPTYIESDRIRQLWFFLAAMRQIRLALRTAPPDLVHIHMSYRGSYVRKNNVCRLCRRDAVPYVLHLHGSQFRSWYDSCNSRLQDNIRRMLREAAAVIVMGERWRDAILKIEPSARVVVICNAVPIPRMSSDNSSDENPAPAGNACADGHATPYAEESAERMEDPASYPYHMDSGVGNDSLSPPGRMSVKRPTERLSGRGYDRFQVLYLGVLIPRKGVSDLLEAVRILKETGKLGRMRFVIAGSGAEEETLYAMTARYKLEDVVIFTGWVDGGRKETLLRESQALVLPSYAEGLPVAVLEAMAYGLPVIASDVGDTAMAVHDGETGYLIAPGEPQQLAERLTLLCSDRELYGRMSRNARHLAEEAFSEERLYRQLETCWRTCAGREDASDS